MLAVLMSCTAQAGQFANINAPADITFGESSQVVEQQLTNRCETINRQTISPPQIPGAKTHTQLDCHGFHYAGRSRLAEFVFKDDQLYLSWILVEASELGQLEQTMQHTYGEPAHRNPAFTAWTSQRTALRKDVPEVLFYADAAAEQFAAWFRSAEL